uniref:DNA gyrase inhibitor YacG n=1 Tax=Yoonia sp. TaxID=2212373 RepID=UPI0040470C4C|tara:strand:+ start:14140 stop:14322 length:183 start_codon:yes stop_codon:yes gene_type:complete
MACPICDRKTVPAFRPFCSKRCADVDLSKWLSGSYAIPSNDPEDAEELFDEPSKAEDKPH